MQFLAPMWCHALSARSHRLVLRKVDTTRDGRLHHHHAEHVYDKHTAFRLGGGTIGRMFSVQSDF